MNINGTLIGSNVLHKIVKNGCKKITSNNLDKDAKDYSKNIAINLITQLTNSKKFCTLPKPDISNNSFTEPVNLFLRM